MAYIEGGKYQSPAGSQINNQITYSRGIRCEATGFWLKETDEFFLYEDLFSPLSTSISLTAAQSLVVTKHLCTLDRGCIKPFVSFLNDKGILVFLNEEQTRSVIAGYNKQRYLDRNKGVEHNEFSLLFTFLKNLEGSILFGNRVKEVWVFNIPMAETKPLRYSSRGCRGKKKRK